MDVFIYIYTYTHTRVYVYVWSWRYGFANPPDNAYTENVSLKIMVKQGAFILSSKK